MGNLSGLKGKKNKEIVRKKNSDYVSSNQIGTGTERSNLINSYPSSDILTTEPMRRSEGEAKQGKPKEISSAMKLHQQLESAGGYEQLGQFDPRRRTMLQTYLTTEKSAADIGEEVGLGSRSRATELIHSAMELAFFALPEDQRAEYDNSPSIALQTRSRQQTQIKSERLKEAHSNRPKNAETGKIEFSPIHKRRLSEGNSQRWLREREASQMINDQNNKTPGR